MKKYIVIYVNGNTEESELDEEFNTKQQALAYVNRGNADDPDDEFTEDTYWEYHIYERVSSFRTDVKVKAEITHTES
jgi:hypothetical protein